MGKERELSTIENVKDHRTKNTAHFHILEVSKIVKFTEPE